MSEGLVRIIQSPYAWYIFSGYTIVIGSFLIYFLYAYFQLRYLLKNRKSASQGSPTKIEKIQSQL